jgi:hypothetical protein
VKDVCAALRTILEEVLMLEGEVLLLREARRQKANRDSYAMIVVEESSSKHCNSGFSAGGVLPTSRQFLMN